MAHKYAWPSYSVQNVGVAGLPGVVCVSIENKNITSLAIRYVGRSLTSLGLRRACVELGGLAPPI